MYGLTLKALQPIAFERIWVVLRLLNDLLKVYKNQTMQKCFFFYDVVSRIRLD